MITVLVQPRTAIACSEQLKFLSEILNLRQIDIACVYQIDRQDVNKMIHGQKRIPERCIPAHMLLLELAHRRANAYGDN
ncbi:hypothetical protein ACUNZS_001000 [Escherichia coli]